MDLKRLRWATRRGMLELDLVLLPFLENVFPSLSDDHKVLFETLLTCEDQELFNWFLKKGNPEDPDMKIIVDIIRANTGLQPDN
ncbi:succinate dehydrogenase assembly factor 2 [Agarilytica rhodophyticola]|uniref:FAD assembly factor SdhE n=1 Tax=Agarilytica rhodophyticola TaxID=1737490 RepID=UPI000B349273|nr:succinate dehydrogenase assembly factor 2 [Agarilytica rhodophyticola]